MTAVVNSDNTDVAEVANVPSPLHANHVRGKTGILRITEDIHPETRRHVAETQQTVSVSITDRRDSRNRQLPGSVNVGLWLSICHERRADFVAMQSGQVNFLMRMGGPSVLEFTRSWAI